MRIPFLDLTAAYRRGQRPLHPPHAMEVYIRDYSEFSRAVTTYPPYVVLTNDPHPPSEVKRGVTLHDYVAVATMPVILPGVDVGQGALIGANSSVGRNVEPDTVVAGAPAKFICRTDEILLKDGSERPAYPCRRHFSRGYLSEVVARWLAEFGVGAGAADDVSRAES